MRMTKDMYESLQVKDLKEIAASRGLSIPARMKKEEIVGKLLELDHAEDEQVLREREAVRGRQGSQTADAAEHKGPARRGRRPSLQKREPAADGRRNAKAEGTGGEKAAPEKRKPGRPRKNSLPAAGADQEAVGKGQPASAAPAASQAPEVAYPEGTPAAEPAKVQEGAPAVSRSSYQENVPAATAAPVPAAPTRPEPVPSQAVAGRYARRGLIRPDQQIVHKNELNHELDSGEMAHGILEVMADGYGFIRSSNYMPGDNDVYVAPSQIRRFNLKTGDIIEGNIRIRSQNEKFSALLFVKSVNGVDPEESKRRFNFEDMTPIFPDDRIRLEKPGASIAMRVMDLMCPVGKGQRGMIVSPPKAGKTTLVKEVAKSVKANNPDIHLIILLIDERPEEVTDIREALEGPNVEVIYSTFDELPEHHKRVAEMTIERAKRLVEGRRDVMILLDSITRLTRAYNLTEPSSGRTLSGGLDPVALHMPKRFFGAARNMREGGSLTILATALIETGSKMDDVVYEEFKGTGNMEMILNRKLSERRIFPAVDLAKSGTRRDDLLLTPDEQECVATIRKAFIGSRGEEATDSVLDLFYKTRTNGEFVSMVKKHMWSF